MAAELEEFSRFANLFPEPVLLVSSSGQLCAANEAARRVLLLDGPLAGDDTLLRYLADESAQLLDYLRVCSRSAEPLPGSFSLRAPQSAPVNFRCMGASFRSRDEHQRPLVLLRLTAREASTSRFVALNQQIEQLRSEVARRIRAEQAAHDQRHLLQVTLASIGDAVIATDALGRITFMNPAAERHLDCSRAQCVGRPLQEVFVIRNEETGESLIDPVQQVLTSGGAVALSNHTVLIQPDGREVPIDDSAAPIRDDAGRLLGVVLVFHEISESRRLQRELVQQAAALKDADRRKDEFLAVLAHELRNPLSPLRNGLQIARMKTQSDNTLRRTIEIMERQLEHLVRLVDDLMDVSRVTRGVIELRQAPVFILDVLARSVDAVCADIESRRHTLTIDAPVAGVAVRGDADRLNQVFSNLLGNSSKYSPDGGRITLRVATEGPEVVIAVADEGIGIPADQLERVFDMFSQVRIHQGRWEGGLGIGLALVRTIVLMHGGSISAHSAGPGRGSTFTVRLPVLESGAQELPKIATPAAVSTPLRILVVDDNADSAESLRALLELSGHQVRVAAGGAEGLAHLDEFRPALVFMDLGMPGMDGVEATRRIRQRPDADDIMVVALTGWGQVRDREQTRLAGADRHIVKPIGPEDLEEVLGLARARNP